MYCWSCGAQTKQSGEPCNHCGAPPGRVPGPSSLVRGGDHGLRICTGCGYRGEGVRYFQRAGHAGLLAAATLLTYGLGGLVYWLVKRHDQVCPACGLSWRRSRTMGAALPSHAPIEQEEGGQRLPSRARGRSPDRPVGTSSSLPPSGMARRVMGVVLAILAVLLFGIGLVEAEAGLAVTSLVFGLLGASTFAWGWKARQVRREAVLRGLQGQVLQIARIRGGRLTATDVASELDLTLNGAERVLLSLDDGFRVRSDVTREGLLVFDFPEIRFGGDWGEGRGSRGVLGSDPPGMLESDSPGSA